jgi:hypothetical protein
MMPYPASGGDADRAAKLQEESVLGATDLVKGKTTSDACSKAASAEHPGAADDDELPPVWKRYIDSRLKQFCTR